MAESPQKSDVNRLNQEEAVLILEQADLASQANVPVAPGLRAMAQEAVSNRVRSALNSLADRLEQGEPLLEVLATLHPRLSPLMCSLIQQGSEIGRMDSVLNWAAEQGRRRRALRSQLWSALAYPLVLVSVAILIGSAILIIIVPQFKKIFEDFGTELPGLTVILITLADLVVNYGIPLMVVGGPVAIVGVVFLFLRGNWLVTQRWSVAIPLIGPLFRLLALADFCNLLAIFVEIQMPLHKALRLAGEATTDCGVWEASDKIATDIESGTFGMATTLDAGMPFAIGQMIEQATSAESLAEALRGLAEIYGAQAELNSGAVGVVAEPFLLLGTAMSMGAMVIALFMPLIKLLNDLS